MKLAQDCGVNFRSPGKRYDRHVAYRSFKNTKSKFKKFREVARLLKIARLKAQLLDNFDAKKFARRSHKSILSDPILKSLPPPPPAPILRRNHKLARFFPRLKDFRPMFRFVGEGSDLIE